MLKTIVPSVYSESLFSSSGMPLFILDNLRSAFNVGSVFRTAEALYPAAVFLTGICCRPGNRKLSHTSRGTYATVPWRYFKQAEDAAIWAKKSGRMLVAVENSQDAVPLWEADYDLSSAFMFGNEADGLSPALAGMADISIYYPQSGIRKCINVSSIAAIIAAEIQRRKWLESNGMNT
ncbi:TrmH family RNA methyltransferase [Candidatus Fermentibacteria bacterium]|nr:MAG: TrmH family RNA methyltransferase [Candidatus Fermentibacteria bacterium]